MMLTLQLSKLDAALLSALQITPPTVDAIPPTTEADDETSIDQDVKKEMEKGDKGDAAASIEDDDEVTIDE